MPTRSRNARTKARQKRTMSLLKRALKQAAFEANKNFSTVLMLLAQAGGEVVVTSETIRGVIPTLGKVQYNTEQTEAGARVWIVTADDAAVGTKADDTAEAVTLTDDQLADLKARMDAAHNVPVFEPLPGSVTAELQAEPAIVHGDDLPVMETADEAVAQDAQPVETPADAPSADPTIAAEDPA